jgi:hypothetical protein
MSHSFTLTDEQYAIIKAAADASGSTPEDLFLAWTMAEETRHRLTSPTSYETEEWFRHLGATEEQIAEAKRIAADRSASEANADA